MVARAVWRVVCALVVPRLLIKGGDIKMVCDASYSSCVHCNVSVGWGCEEEPFRSCDCCISACGVDWRWSAKESVIVRAPC